MKNTMRLGCLACGRLAWSRAPFSSFDVKSPPCRLNGVDDPDTSLTATVANPVKRPAETAERENDEHVGTCDVALSFYQK